MSKSKVKAISGKNTTVGRLFLDMLVMVAGALFYAAAIAMFAAPNNIVIGGVTGVSTMLNYTLGLPIGVMNIVINIPLFIWGAVENGKSFLIKTIFATIISSIFIDVGSYLLPVYYGNTLLAALFAGILSGIGLALIFYGGGTTGGTDIISKNIKNHYPFISMGTIIIVADILIIVATMIVYRSIESGLYAVIGIFVGAKVIDVLMYGLARDNGQLIFVVTDKYNEISRGIMNDIVRGVTLLDARGGYNMNEKKVLFCAVRPHQVYKVTNMVSKVDPKAFIVVTKAGIIKGEGFKNK